MSSFVGQDFILRVDFQSALGDCKAAGEHGLETRAQDTILPHVVAV